MSEQVRCFNCRGTKKSHGLGGMPCDCNLCGGTGKIALDSKPVTVVIESTPVLDVIEQVAVASVKIEEPVISEPVRSVIDEVAKVDKRKAIYKRKKTA